MRIYLWQVNSRDIYPQKGIKSLNIIITGSAWLGGLIGIFAGRRLYPIWLGLVTFLFITRVFDLALFHSTNYIRIDFNLAGGILVAGLVAAGSV